MVHYVYMVGGSVIGFNARRREKMGIDNPEKDRLEIMLAEYSALRDMTLNYMAYGENRLKFLLTVIAGAFAGIGIANQWLKDSPTIYMISSFVYLGLMIFGLGTFARTIERSLMIEVFTKGLARIRRFFVDRHPDIANYIIQRSHDDLDFPTIGFLPAASIFLGIPGLMALLNSIMIGTGFMLLLSVIMLLDVSWSFAAGVILALIVYGIQARYYAWRIEAVSHLYPAVFPTPRASVNPSND